MADKNGFFDNMSAKQGFIMGVLVGIAAFCVIALVVMLSGGSLPKLADGKVAVNTNAANTNVAPTPTPTPTPTPSGGDFSKVPAVTSADHIKGASNAKVTLIEYSDFQCPFCGQLEPTLEKLMSDYQGKIRLVYRQFPLTTIHPYAQKAAEASECASEQGKFWEMHDMMFKDQSALDVPSLKADAQKLGLNTSQFNTCLDSGKYASKVSQMSQDAQGAGITGTPGTFVGNQLVAGAYPYATFKQIIDSLLQ